MLELTGAGGLGQTLGNIVAFKNLRSFKFKGMLRSGVSPCDFQNACPLV